MSVREAKMVPAQRHLIERCKEFNLDKAVLDMQQILNEGIRELKCISQDALQWLEELKEQQKAGVSINKEPLLPQTPTMKRKLRKRKIPPIEDPEKENSAAVTRSRRAASQAANLKFHEQLNFPRKMRRPSSPKWVEEEKVNSSLNAKHQNQKQLKVQLIDVSDDDILSAETKISASFKKDSGIDMHDDGRPRVKKHKASDEVPNVIEVAVKSTATYESSIKTRLRKNEDIASVEETQQHQRKSQNVVHVEPNSAVLTDVKEDILSTVKAVSPLLIDETRKLKIEITRLTGRVTGTVKVTPQGTLVLLDTPPIESVFQKNITLEMQSVCSSQNTDIAQVIEDNQSPTKTISPVIKKTVAPINSQKETNAPMARQGELLALTPHLKGIVRDRVEAVEKSLKKDKTTSKIAQNDKSFQTPSMQLVARVSSDEFESAKSKASEQSPTLSFAPLNSATTSTALRVHKNTDLKKQKRSPSTPSRSLVVKLFPNTSTLKRSKSDQNLSSTDKTLPAIQPRSRVLTGIRTFMKPSSKEQAATVAAENDKKRKIEEVQRNLERIQDAAKKKEEQLRLKKEQKKRENDEKRARALHAQETRVREQEEALRLEKEREERKALHQKLKEEKEQAEKVARKELKKLKLAEREQRRKEVEAAQHAKAQEMAAITAHDTLRRDEERKAELTKGGWTSTSNLKVQTLKTAALPPPTKVAPFSTKPAHQANATFELPSKYNPVAKATQMNVTHNIAAHLPVSSYAMTPSKEDLPPVPSKNVDDYGIDEVDADDPSDDDEKPKKQIPRWARNLKANVHLDCADYASIGLRNRLFGTRVFKPSSQELFGVGARTIQRRSSALWNTPPNVHHISMCSSFIEGH